ncbi:LYR motif-containing protein 2 isoform X2 [Narcine bancroftii]|uniref:LYR motif-containing protein 2 isoform X2 n=1 Tax=Narcine bancroftii TaxID=1343680 RepID=UPI003831A663
MAAGRLAAGVLGLKEFIHRKNVLSLYRKILKAINQIPNEGDKQHLKNWARQEFKQNKNATDQPHNGFFDFQWHKGVILAGAG